MVLPSSGLPISFSEMRNEFGPTQVDDSLSIGSYRISDDIGTLTDLPLDDGVPQSGTIKSSDLYSKRLNVVIDLFSGSPTVRESSRAIYDNARSTPTQQIVPVGRFKSPSQVPASGTGSRIITNVNKTIGSEKGNRNNVALKTGQWGSNTLFEIVIGSSGALYGAGGDGGFGGGIPGSAGQGGQGTSALGIEYPTTMINQGLISAGVGGGGGGSGGWGWTFSDTQDGCEGRQDEQLRIGGGGGAGGRGFPSGNGGSANTSSLLNSGANANFAQSGTSGTINSNGSPGGGGSTSGGNGCNRHAFSGAGGAVESSGSGGDVSYGGSGSGGQRGYGIIISPSGNFISRTGNDPDGTIINGVVS